MRLTPRGNRRSGFTVIELLVVMSIVIAIAALSIGAVFSVRESQIKSATETTVQKVSSALDQQLKAMLDQIFEETPRGAVRAITNSFVSVLEQSGPDLAANDRRRGRVLYSKLRLAQEFPETFADVRLFSAAANNVTQPFITNPAYAQAVPGNSPVQDWESSALLYMALKQGRRGQAAFDAATLVEPSAIQTRSVIDTSTNPPKQFDFQVFVDAWGNPLRFYLFPFDNDELNAQPYLTSVANPTGRDPVDPEGTLMVSGWRLSGSTLTPAALTLARYCHRLPSPSDTNPSVAANSNVARSMIAVVVSAGKDGVFGLDDSPLTSPFMRITNQDAQQDNIYSYRLRRAGARGD